MPVIPALSQAIKIGANFVPQDAVGHGTIQSIAQACLTMPALLPQLSFAPAPVIGIPIAIIMSKLKVIPAENAQKVVKLISKLQNQYIKDLNSAQTKRKTAEEKLYNDLVAKQLTIKEDVAELESKIPILEREIEDGTKEKEKQLFKYQAQMIKYANYVKLYYEQGKMDKYQEYIAKIAEMDHWFGDIMLLWTDVINKKLELKFLQFDLETYKPLAEIAITPDWETNIELANQFEVAVPYYPDLPNQPTMPTVPKIIKMPDFLRTFEIQFAKWLVCPVIIPTGITIAALLLMLKEVVPNDPIQAAQIDAQIEQMIPLLSGAI